MKSLVVLLLFLLVPVLAYSRNFLEDVPKFVDLNYERSTTGYNQIELEAGLGNSSRNSGPNSYLHNQVFDLKLIISGLGLRSLNHNSKVYSKFRLVECMLMQENIILAAKLLNIGKWHKNFGEITWFELKPGVGWGFPLGYEGVLATKVLLPMGYDSYKADKEVYPDIGNAFRGIVNNYTVGATFQTLLFIKTFYTVFEFTYKRFFDSPHLSILSSNLKLEIFDLHKVYGFSHKSGVYGLNWSLNLFLDADFETLMVTDKNEHFFSMSLGFVVFFYSSHSYSI